MKRFLLVATLLAAPAFAHHGWSSFDQDRPYYLQGTVKSVRWANPHAEAVLEVKSDLAVPADLSARTLPKQTQNVDAAAIAAKVRVPPAPAGEWQVEFAPLTRMQAWGMGTAPKVGDRIEVIGYTGPEVAGGRLMRVEYVFHEGRVAGLRSSPAN
jgi:Family of unknown function (DUF6152)